MIVMRVVNYCVVKFLRLIRALYLNLTTVEKKKIKNYRLTEDDNVVSIESDSEDEETYGSRSSLRVSFSPSTARREFEKDIECHSTNPFFNFLTEFRIQMHRKKEKGNQFSKKAGELWRNMSRDQKLPYFVYAHKKRQLLAHQKAICASKSQSSHGIKRLSRVHLGRKCRTKSLVSCLKKRSSTSNNIIL